METNSIEFDSLEQSHRTERRRTVYMTEPGLKFTRLRYLGGMTLGGWVWDSSYAHGQMPDGELVDIHLVPEMSQIRCKSRSQQELIYHLVQIGIQYNVHMMRAGMRGALSTLC